MKECKSYVSAIIIEFEGHTEIKAYDDDVELDRILYDASKIECFSDCSDENVKAVYWHGKEYKYFGWEPNMRFVWYDPSTADPEHDEMGEVVFDCCFPEWDH